MVLTLCNLCWWCFPWSTSAFTNVHTATCTVWWWWLYFYAVAIIAHGGSGCMYVVVAAVHAQLLWRFCCSYTKQGSILNNIPYSLSIPHGSQSAWTLPCIILLYYATTHHHHTVQVAICAYSFVCTLVNAQGQDLHYKCRSLRDDQQT